MALLPYSVRQVQQRSKGKGRGDRGDRGERRDSELSAEAIGLAPDSNRGRGNERDDSAGYDEDLVAKYAVDDDALDDAEIVINDDKGDER